MFALIKIIDKCLYTIKIIVEKQNDIKDEEREEIYDAGDEFTLLFNNWSNAEYLYDFFEANYNDLNSGFFAHSISIEQAVIKTIHEAALLEQKLIDIAEKGKTHHSINLQNIFRPLHNSERQLSPPPRLQHTKAYGSKHRSWLRVYAIRIDQNLFIITGGAIKLTRDMNTRPHLIAELEKLHQVKKYLIEQQIIDLESLTEFLEIDL